MLEVGYQQFNCLRYPTGTYLLDNGMISGHINLGGESKINKVTEMYFTESLLFQNLNKLRVTKYFHQLIR